MATSEEKKETLTLNITLSGLVHFEVTAEQAKKIEEDMDDGVEFDPTTYGKQWSDILNELDVEAEIA